MIRVKRFKNIHDYFAGPMYRISWCYCKSHRLYYSINPYRVIWEMSTIINYREVRCTRFAKLRTMFARSAAMVILSYFFSPVVFDRLLWFPRLISSCHTTSKSGTSSFHGYWRTNHQSNEHYFCSTRILSAPHLTSPRKSKHYPDRLVRIKLI